MTKVLVVYDDEFYAESIRERLEHYDHKIKVTKVVNAEAAKEAIAKAGSKKPFDIIITKRRMPEQGVENFDSGIDLAKSLREAGNKAPMISLAQPLTHVQSVDLIGKGIINGFIDRIKDMDQLGSMVKRLTTEKSQNSQQL